MLTWLQRDVEGRKKHAHHLLDHVSWKKLPSPFLLKVLLRHPLLKIDPTIKRLVLDRVRQSYDDEETDDYANTFLNTGNAQNSSCNNTRVYNVQEQTSLGAISSSRDLRSVQFPHQALLLIGGLTLGEAERGDTSQPNVMSYHPLDHSWRQRASWPERGLRGFSVTKLDDNVVVSGESKLVWNRFVESSIEYHLSFYRWMFNYCK